MFDYNDFYNNIQIQLIHHYAKMSLLCIIFLLDSCSNNNNKKEILIKKGPLLEFISLHLNQF